ncbi:putative F-box domain, galactose oxidase/kelch, beta-propeller, F-box associated interaction [Medicago truncatula]|uniref:F-box protein interaction domain protein n=1 Tax=Medicago truncatula TaxID=3880 RepID=A0A072V2A2_MEDTR|nr:F-box/kelch-repeat protein At3g06240 [Medicago truncatula]XP_039689542.1 F-box/kelch-repeat protein At3g06240 [Medicago truncatula]KEH32240.1 F-box protein interaction domain protein [Medicago truncatula]KEH32243.1 F-box protein interaction domain protein [Medicago truncatula]RHN64159.1 putative F-box domain, galactose oxidase/kelch, beta-propeller, F-box associated interaction [Medicago truncatula]
MEKKTIPLPHLHHELIVQILLRLPVNSLIRFKCVCKSWFFLISDPLFANSHFHLTAATHTRRILFISPPPRSIDLEASLAYDSISSSVNLDFLLPESYYDFEIKGSCRGFILLHCAPTLYLWNPSTGFHKQIPLCPSWLEEDDDDERLYGFGYDQLTDDYLVVLSFFPYISSHFEFFSLRANTWIQIECTDSPFANGIDDKPSVGSLYNGAIHWLAYRAGLGKNVILAFDLTERQLFDMLLPDDYYNYNYDPNNCGLWVFGEFLSLYAMDYNDNTIEMWVMNEYKVNSSWTKTLVLSVDDISDESFSPLCCTKSGDIIGAHSGIGLVKYDDNGQLLGRFSKWNVTWDGSVAIYTESLLSLPGDNEQV